MLDFSVAFTLVILLSPILIVVSLIILVMDGTPVLFRQDRPGLNEKKIRIFKFRTMNKGGSDDPAADFQRITRLGAILRRTSLDELPQLFNVLRGELSLVGPRPLLMEYLPLYNSRQKKRHLVKPGITGWAQVNGRNLLTWEQKFEYDVWYVENWSLLLDIKILFRTFLKVIKSSDTNAGENVTMQKFKGSNSNV